MAFRELGRRFVDRDVFDEIEDFGFLLSDEADELFGPTPERLTERIRERRARHRRTGGEGPTVRVRRRVDRPGHVARACR